MGTISMLKRKPKPRTQRTNVASHSYNPQTGTLTVHFTSGAQYEYHNVPKDIAHGFTGSSSSPERGSGAYLHQHIIGTYKHKRIE